MRKTQRITCRQCTESPTPQASVSPAGQCALFALVKAKLTSQHKEQACPLFHSMLGGIVLLNLDGIIVNVNERAAGMFAMCREELTGLSFLELVAPEEHEYVKAKFKEAYEIGMVHSLKSTLMKKSGYCYTGETSIGLIQDSFGTQTGFVVVIRIIAEDKMELEEIVKREERWRSLISNLPDVAWIMDEDYNIVFVSPNIERITGYTQEEMYQCRTWCNWGERVHPEDKEQSLAAMHRMVDEGQHYDMEYRYKTKDGSWVWLRDRSLGAYQWHGSRYADGLLSDITQQKRMLDALRQSEEFTSNILSRVPIPIVVFNEDTSVRYVNPAFERITGFRSSELTGVTKPYPWLIQESIKETGKEFRWASANGMNRLEEVFRKRNGEQFRVQVTSTPVRFGGEAKYYLSSWIDVTKERRLREDLQFYINEITKAQEKERARIARELHDGIVQTLFSLITEIEHTIEGSTHLSKSEVQRLRLVQSKINTAMDETRHFSHELRPALLDHFGLIPSLELLTNELQQDGKACHLEVAGRKHRLATEIELQIFRIAQEAIHNVRKHSNATEARLKIQFCKEHVIVRISDNGCDFDVPKLLGSYVRIGKLGLAGIHERARIIGAKLWIKSERGRGTVVTVVVPLGHAQNQTT